RGALLERLAGVRDRRADDDWHRVSVLEASSGLAKMRARNQSDARRPVVDEHEPHEGSGIHRRATPSRLRCVRPAHSTLRAPSPSLDPGHEPIERASRAGPARQEPLLDAPVPCCHPEHEARTDSLQLGIALAPAVALGIEGAAQVVEIALETRDTDRRLLARDAVMLECALELLELSRRALALSSESVEVAAALLA